MCLQDMTAEKAGFRLVPLKKHPGLRAPMALDGTRTTLEVVTRFFECAIRIKK